MADDSDSFPINNSYPLLLILSDISQKPLKGKCDASPYVSTSKTTDIFGGDAFSFLKMQKMLKKFLKKCVTNGSRYVTQMADDSVSFPINNSYPLLLILSTILDFALLIPGPNIFQ